MGDVIVKTVREVFSGVGFGIIPHPGVLRFCQIQPLMLYGESHLSVQEMSEFMECRVGFRDVDGFPAVVGGSNAAHVQLVAEFSHVVEINAVCPSGGIEDIEDRFGYLPQFQQKIVDMYTRYIYQRHRSCRSLHGEGCGKDGVEEYSSFPAGHDLIRIILLFEALCHRSNTDAVFIIGQRYAALIEYAVIDRNPGCGKGTFVESAAAELRIGCENCSLTQSAFSVGLLHSILAQFAPRVSFGFHTMGAAEHDSPLTGRNRRIRGEASVSRALRDLMLRKIHHALIAVRSLQHVIKACAGSGSSRGQDQCQDKGADSQRCSSNDHLHKFLHILVLSLSCILR